MAIQVSFDTARLDPSPCNPNDVLSVCRMQRTVEDLMDIVRANDLGDDYENLGPVFCTLVTRNTEL